MAEHSFVPERIRLAPRHLVAAGAVGAALLVGAPMIAVGDTKQPVAVAGPVSPVSHEFATWVQLIQDAVAPYAVNVDESLAR